MQKPDTGMIISQFVTTDTPLAPRKGEIRGVCSEFKLWFMFRRCHHIALCCIGINWAAL